MAKYCVFTFAQEQPPRGIIDMRLRRYDMLTPQLIDLIFPFVRPLPDLDFPGQ